MKQLMFLLGFGATAVAQQHELILSLGGFLPSSRTGAATKIDQDGSLALGAAYGYRLAGGSLEGNGTSLYLDTHFLASFNRFLNSANRQVSKGYATLYLTPALRLKFASNRKASPFVQAGGGYALYEQSPERIDNGPNPVAKFIHRGALMYGGGLDVRFWRFTSLRAEIRDFYSGSPRFNAPVSGGQHNVIVTGGLLARW